jgi:hypothetical protein
MKRGSESAGQRGKKRPVALTVQLSLFSWLFSGELSVKTQASRSAAQRAEVRKRPSGAKTPALMRERRRSNTPSAQSDAA